MSRKVTVLTLCAMLFGLCGSVNAQQPGKVPRIGLLIASSSSPASPRIEAFRQGLQELGYVEGKNIVVEYRYADGKPDRLPALAAELVSLKINIIVTGGVGTNPCRQGSNSFDPYSHDPGYRSCRERVCRQSRTTWRQYHGIVQLCAGVERETDRAAKGDCT